MNNVLFVNANIGFSENLFFSYKVCLGGSIQNNYNYGSNFVKLPVSLNYSKYVEKAYFKADISAQPQKRLTDP